MGYTSYSVADRSERASILGYNRRSVTEIFTQQKEKTIHSSMSPKDVVKRECLDSIEHPNTVPIQLYLDVTGSMGMIPHMLIKEGLPKIISSLIQNGVKDVALMFGAIGDHEYDNYPLQVAQFESGDAELDMWLTRTYLEGGGGGNDGESYLLAWYFAAFHTVTDSFNKRGKKGFVFTIGDEPCLKTLPIRGISDIMSSTVVGQSTYTAESLLKLAEEKNHVYHINITHDYRSLDNSWIKLMGDKVINLTDINLLSSTISNIVLSVLSSTTNESISDNSSCDAKQENIIL